MHFFLTVCDAYTCKLTKLRFLICIIRYSRYYRYFFSISIYWFFQNRNCLPVHCRTHEKISHLVASLLTSRQQVVFALLVPSCQQVWNTLFTTCNKHDGISDLFQGRSNKSDTVTMTTQGCTNIVISWLYQTCWNNLATSLLISTRLLQVVNSLFQTCWQLGTSSAKFSTQLVARLTKW
jgi:hypothetical protein